MSDLTSRFENLKKKKDALEKRKMQAELRTESLTKEIQEDLNTLKEKYNVATLEEAKALLTAKDVELKNKVGAIEEELYKFENTLDLTI